MQMLNFSTYCIFMFTGIKFCQFYNYKLLFYFWFHFDLLLQEWLNIYSKLLFN